MNEIEQILIFYAAFLLAVLLPRIPFIGKFFRAVNTLIHEAGHAVMAVLTGSGIKKIELFSDLSGTATTVSDSKFKQFLISLAGYPSSVIVSLFFFFLLENNNYNFIYYVLAVVSLICLILFVRNAYGIFWLVFFTGICVALVYFNIKWLMFAFAVFISSILLWESIISTLILIRISFKTPNAAGDATNLKKSALLPPQFWAVLFFIINISVAAFVIYKYFKNPLILFE